MLFTDLQESYDKVFKDILKWMLIKKRLIKGTRKCY